MRPLVFATRNRGKLVELRALLPGTDVLSIDEAAARLGRAIPEVDEDRPTFAGNAAKKAREVSLATGLPALADDSGLEVDALDGAPGVHSARYAGEHASYADNVAKLLRELEGVYPSLRTARFATVAIARHPGGDPEIVTRGEVEGVISAGARGEGGFGYDPVFVPVEGDGRSFAEMTPEEKHALSHRGRAFRALAAELGRGS
jgi:XTP/dITP diphosphohydrolase